VSSVSEIKLVHHLLYRCRVCARSADTGDLQRRSIDGVDGEPSDASVAADETGASPSASSNQSNGTGEIALHARALRTVLLHCSPDIDR